MKGQDMTKQAANYNPEFCHHPDSVAPPLEREAYAVEIAAQHGLAYWHYLQRTDEKKADKAFDFDLALKGAQITMAKVAFVASVIGDDATHGMLDLAVEKARERQLAKGDPNGSKGHDVAAIGEADEAVRSDDAKPDRSDAQGTSRVGRKRPTLSDV